MSQESKAECSYQHCPYPAECMRTQNACIAPRPLNARLSELINSELAPHSQQQEKSRDILKLDGLSTENRLAVLTLAQFILGGDDPCAMEVDLYETTDAVRDAFQTLTVALLNAQLWLKQRNHFASSCTDLLAQLEPKE